MTCRTLTRADIGDTLAHKLSIPRQRANELLESVLDLMADAIVAQDSLKLASFGSFSVRKKNTRVGRNPKTGQEVMITPRKTISFRASNVMKDKVLKA
jgi:integration host factor subunit alpha